MKIIKLICYTVLFSLIAGFSHAQKIRRVDFEAGGFVLAQIPTMDGKKVYARTDIGGVYKKTVNGNWEFISEFAKSPAALMVQSIDINPYNQNEIGIACGMDYLPDDEGRGVWKTTDEGKNWYKALGPETGNSEVNFGGNVFRVKIGGPCLKWHPLVKGRIYAGTLADPQTGKPVIFCSNANGEPGTWFVVNGNSGITGNTVSIAMHSEFPDEVWIGTDKGLWRSSDNGATWSAQLFPEQINGVYQILLKKTTSGKLRGFVSTGSLFRIDDNCTTFKDLSYTYGSYSGYGTEIIGLTWKDSKEIELLVTRMGNDAKYTTDDGETWTRRIDFILEKEFNPKHTLFTQDKIYSSNIIGTHDPVNPLVMYFSGGAGPFVSTNAGKTFRFNGQGIDMTVVYDVTFSSGDDIYISLSDWGMAKTNDATLPKVLDYSRKYTLDPPPPENNGDTYIPNVCKTLISKLNSDRIYLIGGSVYSYYPVITKSEKKGAPGSYRILSPPGLLSYPNFGPGHDAIIVDGEITTDGFNDHIILLMGAGSFKRKIYDPDNPEAYWYGVYYSSNGGGTFEKSTFEGASDEIYKHSVVGALFSPTDYLEVDPKNNSNVYLYMEGGNDPKVKAGGLFVSTDYGRTFTFKNYIVDNPEIDYRNHGAIDIDPLGSGKIWSAIENYGLFRSDDMGEYFIKHSGWTSATTLDSRGSHVIVFGKRDGDAYNKLYLSKDNGMTWEHIYIPGYGIIPSVRRLELRPNKENELWISTGGQGVFIYNY